MNNRYLLDMPYVEEIETLEEFQYDSYVKCKIKSLCIQSPIIKEEYQPHIINTSNIQNRNSIAINICRVTNYIDVYIPSMYSYEGPGKPGMKFLITFTGGDITKFTVCGRYY